MLIILWAVHFKTARLHFMSRKLNAIKNGDQKIFFFVHDRDIGLWDANLCISIEDMPLRP